MDLLGYFSVSECQAGNKDTIAEYSWAAVEMLRSQNTILGLHANSAIYTCLSQLVVFTGYYLESDPCLVCNNPEVSFTNLKLSSLKMDTMFSTHTQMVKLSPAVTASSRIGTSRDNTRTKCCSHDQQTIILCSKI